MSNLMQVLFTCDSNNSLWTCCVWDPHTGTSLMTYKGSCNAELKTLSFIGEDYLVLADSLKPIMHVWPLNSHQTIQGMRFVLPGKASALTISRDGSYCAAGIDEKIYLWQISSGSLLTIISRHYQKIKLLKFTPDGRYIVSAAEDGIVMVWSLATVTANPEVELVTQSIAGQHDPVYTFSDHSLPITDLYISKMGMQGRLCTVSVDRTCKIYDLSSGEMLLNLIFDAPLLSVTMDVLELNVYVGNSEGKILHFSLFNPPRSRDHYVCNETLSPTFISHSKGVTCLSVSLDGETLMSGSNDEQVILWHIRSRQPIRVFKHKGPITNALFMVNMKAIYEHEFTPSTILHNLQRTLENAADEPPVIEVLTNKSVEFWPMSEDCQIDMQQLLKQNENEHFTKESSLKDEIQKLKKINTELYKFSMQKAIKNFPPVAIENVKKKKSKVN